MKTQTIQAGDHVAYSASFLRSIGCFAGPPCFVRGVVQRVTKYGALTLASVEWNDPIEDGSAVNVANLVRVEDMHLECVL